MGDWGQCCSLDGGHDPTSHIAVSRELLPIAPVRVPRISRSGDHFPDSRPFLRKCTVVVARQLLPVGLEGEVGTHAVVPVALNGSGRTGRPVLLRRYDGYLTVHQIHVPEPKSFNLAPADNNQVSICMGLRSQPAPGSGPASPSLRARPHLCGRARHVRCPARRTSCPSLAGRADGIKAPATAAPAISGRNGR